LISFPHFPCLRFASFSKSAYNFYFQLERERIINSDENDRDTIVSYTVEDVARIALVQQKKAKENKPKEKRSHRKTHGKISFGDLARTIAGKWKKLGDASKAIFEGSAALEKERYRKELAEWNKQQKKWKEAAAKMTMRPMSTPMMHHGSYPVVTPTQVPKRTVAAAHSHRVDSSPSPPNYDDHMLQAVLAQQKKLLEQSAGFGKPAHAKPTSDFRKDKMKASGRMMLPQNDESHTSMNNRRVTTGMLPSYAQSFGYNNAMSKNVMLNGNAVNMGRMDSHVGGNDYDDVAEETYQRAQMSLSNQHQATFNRRNPRMMIMQRRMMQMQQMQIEQEHQLQQMRGSHDQAFDCDFMDQSNREDGDNLQQHRANFMYMGGSQSQSPSAPRLQYHQQHGLSMMDASGSSHYSQKHDPPSSDEDDDEDEDIFQPLAIGI
jgi:HMG (high mobility group) box